MATAKSGLVIFRVLQARHSHLDRNFQHHNHHTPCGISGFDLLLLAAPHALQMLISDQAASVHLL
jgi:hypothetical protein